MEVFEGQQPFRELLVTYLSGGGVHGAGGRTRCASWPPLGLGLALILKHTQSALIRSITNACVKGWFNVELFERAQETQEAMTSSLSNWQLSLSRTVHKL